MEETFLQPKKLGLSKSLFIFGSLSLLLILETRFIIPWLARITGLEPVVFWFIVAGLGLFFPLLILSLIFLKAEGQKIDKETWTGRLRFRQMNRMDWLWSLGAVVVIGILSVIILNGLKLITGHVENHPPFMAYEPLTPDRYWILLIWFPYWLFNIMGEEIFWRGVLLPGQELAFGKNTWIIHGFCWAIFHIAFGWKMLLIMLPILFIQSFVVQKRKNSWTGVVIHALVNGPGFLAISFGWL
ncbi:CPBP family intramembrane metalloprotease [candidate division KSB1 bacterium]|nr:CPBP family intramembrane metalloprotease [candidate division KSB1 bacterium]